MTAKGKGKMMVASTATLTDTFGNTPRQRRKMVSKGWCFRHKSPKRHKKGHVCRKTW